MGWGGGTGRWVGHREPLSLYVFLLLSVTFVWEKSFLGYQTFMKTNVV